MKRDVSAHLQDMLDEMSNAESFVSTLSAGEFMTDKKTLYAVLYSLSIIGEAATKLPASFVQNYPLFEWRKIKGMRNIIIRRLS